MPQRICFTVELAGIPIEIRCSHEENRTFLQDYLTEKAPLFTVEPSDADLEQMWCGFEQIALAEGRKPVKHTESYLENNAIHSLIAEGLTAYDVLLMHGSALCMDGEAYLFTAPSGTGKSTHARYWREVYGERVWMVNDDKPLLRFLDGQILVYGTPWNGMHSLSRNASAPLKAVVALSRDETNWIRPLTPADAFGVVFKQAFSSRDPAVMRRILEMEKKLLGSAKFYEMGCNQSPESSRMAYEGMNN